ncbi:MAG: hypothetical protein FWG49_06825, partial [Leptospirales bacterium]|nr:hypothetical protein [Leptospirales bacterium]
MMRKNQVKESVRFIILTVFTLILIASPLSVMTVIAQDGDRPVNNSSAEDNVPGQNFVEDDFKPQIEEESASWLIIKTILVLALFIGGFYYF